MKLFNKSELHLDICLLFFGDLTCGMCYRLDLGLKSLARSALQLQIFYQNGIPDRSDLLSPVGLPLLKFFATPLEANILQLKIR